MTQIRCFVKFLMQFFESMYPLFIYSLYKSAHFSTSSAVKQLNLSVKTLSNWAVSVGICCLVSRTNYESLSSISQVFEVNKWFFGGKFDISGKSQDFFRDFSGKNRAKSWDSGLRWTYNCQKWILLQNCFLKRLQTTSRWVFRQIFKLFFAKSPKIVDVLCKMADISKKVQIFSLKTSFCKNYLSFLWTVFSGVSVCLHSC